ncbi:MAG: insulinase family protein [Betaproteobacteria bacterium]|nr:insulinase family protein [Betaproteobacteria bacterium]
MRGDRFVVFAAAALSLAVALPARAILPIQHWQTAGGTRVYFVENRDLPMLDVSVEFPAGASLDPRDKSGLASMTQGMLKRGADGISEEEIARRLADAGARLSGRFDSDRAGLALRTLSSRAERDAALEVLARVLQRPDFPQAVLEREKVRLTGALKEADTRPESIASVRFYRMVYGDHPYALRLSGEVETIAGLTREDLVEFHRRHYTARAAVIAMVGDVSRKDAEAIAERLVGRLPPGAADEAALPQVRQPVRGETAVIAHPATQSHILIGGPGIKRDDPDYFPLFVGNYVLGGGGLVSRISVEVREKRGLAYSAYSYFTPLKYPGPFVIGMQTKRDQAGEALKVVRDTLREFIAEGPTAKELEDAKASIVGGFPLRIDSNRKIHEHLALIGFYRLSLTYLEEFMKNVERVTIADVRSAFARRIDPDRLATVIVGADEGEIKAAAQ